MSIHELQRLRRIALAAGLLIIFGTTKILRKALA